MFPFCGRRSIQEKLNTYTNLQNESYTFDVSQQGEINNRFEITYQPESTLSISVIFPKNRNI